MDYVVLNFLSSGMVDETENDELGALNYWSRRSLLSVVVVLRGISMVLLIRIMSTIIFFDDDDEENHRLIMWRKMIALN